MLLRACVHLLVCSFAMAYAQGVDLGTAALYGVLAGSDVVNTGVTTVVGAVGVYPGESIIGFPPGVATGVYSYGNQAAETAVDDATTAYRQASGLPCGTDLTGQDLGGMVLTPGVYCFETSATLTGILTLDGDGNSNPLFVFQLGTTLITATGATVTLINGAVPCAIFWTVGSSATLGVGTSFDGNILAMASISCDTDATSSGGLYALTGSVTLIQDAIAAVGSCGSSSTSSSTSSSSTSSSTSSSSTSSSTSSSSTTSSTSSSSTSSSTSSSSTSSSTSSSSTTSSTSSSSTSSSTSSSSTTSSTSSSSTSSSSASTTSTATKSSSTSSSSRTSIPSTSTMPSSNCAHDNCLRAVIGSAFPTRSGAADCSSYFLTTVTSATATSTYISCYSTNGRRRELQPAAAVVAARQATVVPSNIPAYASPCSGSVRYSSACSCIGAKAASTTATARSTTTITVIPTLSATQYKLSTNCDPRDQKNSINIPVNECVVLGNDGSIQLGSLSLADANEANCEVTFFTDTKCNHVAQSYQASSGQCIYDGNMLNSVSVLCRCPLK